MKPLVFAFDVYGTLADTAGIAAALSRYMDSPMAQTFAHKWREKQLEYTFRRALMRRYADFGICTRESLDFVCEAMQLNLDDSAKESVIAEYAQLPLFADAREALESLKKSGARMFAFPTAPKKLCGQSCKTPTPCIFLKMSSAWTPLKPSSPTLRFTRILSPAAARKKRDAG